MAIAFVRAYPASGTLGGHNSAATVNIDTTGVDAIIVFVTAGRGNGGGNMTGASFTTPTLGGSTTGWTELIGETICSGSTSGMMGAWGLLAPSSSSSIAFSINFTGGTGGSIDEVTCVLGLYSGVGSFGTAFTPDNDGTTNQTSDTMTNAPGSGNLTVGAWAAGSAISSVTSGTGRGAINNFATTHSCGCMALIEGSTAAFSGTADINIGMQVELVASGGTPTLTIADLASACTLDAVVVDIPNPVVATHTFEASTSLGSANAQPLPANAAAGDLVLYIVGNDNPSTTAITASTGWTELTNGPQTEGSNVVKGNIFARILTGTTGDNICSVSGAAQDYSIAAIRIASGDHSVVTLPGDIKVAAALAGGTSGNADPPSLNTGSSRPWLFLAAAVIDTTTASTLTAAPTNYTIVENNKSASSSSSVITAVASRDPNVAQTEDPGTFTNSSRVWIAYTIAIPPFVPGVSLTVADLASATTLDAFALVQHNVLATANLASATVLDVIGFLPPFATSISTNSRYLLDQHGDPWFMAGCTPQAGLIQFDSTDWETYFADQGGRGYNYAQVHLIVKTGFEGGGDPDSTNGDPPFGNLSTFASPDTQYWADVDTMIGIAQDHGFTLGLTVADHMSWAATISAMSSTNAHNYGLFLGGRYKDTPGIIWVFGNDFNPDTSSTYDPNYLQILDGIRDAGDTHLTTLWLLEGLHNESSWDDSTWDPTDGTGCDVVLVYSYNTTYTATIKAYRDTSTTAPKPCYLGEASYQFEHDGGAGSTAPLSLRKEAWWPITWGCFGFVKGQYPEEYGTGTGSGGTWDQAIADSGGVALGYIRGIYTQFNGWWDLVPDDGNDLLTGGRGTYVTIGGTDPADNDYFTMSMTPDGKLAIGYCPSSRSGITIDTGQMTGTVIAKWWDPTLDHTQTPVNISNPAAPTHPGTNDFGDADWVIVLQGTEAVSLTVADLAVAVAEDNVALTQHYVGSAANMASATTLDAVLLTQHNTLATAAAASATTLDAVTLTQHGALAVDSESSATVLDGVALTQHGTLVVADLASATVLDAAGALTQHYVLAPAALSVAVAEDNVALTQHGTLVLADLASATELDDLTLVPAGALSAASLAVATTLDNVTLTQHYTLIVQDLAAASAADNVTVSPAVGLAVASLASASSIDSTVLTQHYTLTVAALTVATAADNVTLQVTGTLVVANMASATTLEDVILTQQGALVVASLSVASTLDSPAIVSHHVLTIADLASATTEDAAGALTQHYALHPADLASASSTEPVVLTQHNVLTLASLAVATTVEMIFFSHLVITGRLYTSALDAARITSSAGAGRTTEDYLP